MIRLDLSDEPRWLDLGRGVLLDRAAGQLRVNGTAITGIDITACLSLGAALGYWRRACDNAFTWNLALLSAALWFLTGLRLVRIEGETIRRPGTTSIDL